MATRGIRNNNPGNVRADEQWQGMTGQDEEGFAIFDSPENGLRALSRVLDTYGSKHGLKTVSGILGRYAPPSENDTDAYVRAVSAELNVDAAQELDLANPQTKAALMNAIINHENGSNPYSMDQVSAGISASGGPAFDLEGRAAAMLPPTVTPSQNPNDPWSWDRGQAEDLLQADTPELQRDPLTISRDVVAGIDGAPQDVNLVGGLTGTDTLRGVEDASKKGFFDKVAAGFRVTNSGNDLWNFYQRSVTYPREQAFMDNLPQKYEEFISQVPAEYRDAFTHIRSDAEMRAVIGEIHRDMADMRTLQYSGGTGVVASLLAGTVDIDIGLAILSGGEYTGAKAGWVGARVARIGNGIRQGMLSGTAVGLAQSEFSPTASPMDLSMNILGASTFGGLAGALGRNADLSIDRAIGDIHEAKLRGQKLGDEGPEQGDGGFSWPSVSEMADYIGEPVSRALSGGREALVKKFNQMRAGIDPEAEAKRAAAPEGSASAMATPQGPKLSDVAGMSAETLETIKAARKWRAQTAWKRAVTAAGKNPRVARFLEMVNKVPGMKTDWERLVDSPSAIMNKLSYDLLESAAGILRNNKSAAFLKDLYMRRMISRGNPYEHNFNRWAQEQGANFLDRKWHNEYRERFNKLMQQDLMRRQAGEAEPVDLHPQVKEAVDHWERFTEEGHAIAVGRGNEKSIHGFSADKKRAGYFPVVWRGDKLRTLMDRLGGREKLVDEWAEMINADHPTLTKTEAKATATAFLNRALSKDSEVDSSLLNMLASDGRERLRKELIGRVDEKTADRILDILGGKLEQKRMQANSKARMTMDLRRSFSDGTALLDVVENDMRYLMQSYAHNIGGAAALARKGIRSQADVDDIINQALEEQTALGIREGHANYISREHLEHVFSYFGNGPINKGLHPVVRLMKQVTNLALLNQLGLAQLAETGTQIATVGFKQWLDTATPIVKEFFEKPNTPRAKRLYHELEPLAGKIGDSHNIYRDDILLDEVRRDPSAATTWMDTAEKIALKGRRIQGFTSLFNQIQSAQQKIGIELMIGKVMKELRKEDPDLVRLADIGIQDRVLIRIRDEMTKHVQFDANGNVTMLNIDKWDYGTAEDFVIAMNRSSYQQVQRAMAGEETMWMTKDIGSLFMHLKTFPLLAMKKQFIREGRIMDDQTRAMFMYGLGTAAIAYVAKQALNGNTDRLDPGSIVIGAFGMANMTGWVPMWTDPVASMFGLDEARFNQYGARGVSEGVLPVPAALTTINKMAHIPGAAIHMLPFGGELTNSDISALKTIPLVGNAYGWSAFMNALKD